MIELHNVTKDYVASGRRIEVLRDVSAILPRRNIAVLGSNGSGKSIFLRLVSGSISPSRGRIVRHGLVSWPLAANGVFNRFQTGAENARFIARIYGQDTKFVEKFVLNFSELGQRFFEPLGSYAVGERARFAFGVSMSLPFDYFVVDGVIGAGDERFKKKSRRMFERRLSNARVLMASNNISTLREYCDMAVLLGGGNVRIFEDLEEGLEAATFEATSGMEDDLDADHAEPTEDAL